MDLETELDTHVFFHWLFLFYPKKARALLIRLPYPYHT